DVMRCCAAEMAPHRNPPLPNQQQQPKTAGANSKLDKTWGQGHTGDLCPIEAGGHKSIWSKMTRTEVMIAVAIVMLTVCAALAFGGLLEILSLKP
ncbi:hypothetical protein, partial [Rhizobium laguerreae]|uniref:hypothetical protein n=1 Tax=Rhizobium laguerreae TaxID=1076926 RepID=UPI001C9015B1